MVRAATALADSSPSTYLEKRKLAPPFVGPLQLAGFIIGIVISGAFTGWNTGLSFGFINMAVAVGLATVMYLTLVLSVCEMCSALPFASGPASYAQAALNSGSAHSQNSGHPFCRVLDPAGRTCLGPQLSPRLLFRAAIVLSFYSCLLLLAYLTLAFIILPTKRNTPPNPIDGRTDLYYNDGQGRASIDTSQLSVRGVIAAFPFACWLYVGIESFPTASEEARKIFRTAPTAGLYATFFLAFFAVTLLTTAPQLGGSQIVSGVVSAGAASMQHLVTANGTSVAVANATAPHVTLADFSHSNHPLLDNVLNLVCSRYQSPLPTWCQPSPSPLTPSSTDFFHKGHPLITMLVLLTLLPPLFLSLITARMQPHATSIPYHEQASFHAHLENLAARRAKLLDSHHTCRRHGRCGYHQAAQQIQHGRPIVCNDCLVGPFGSTGAGGVVATAPGHEDGVGGFFCPTGDAETSLAILQVSAWLACVSYVLEFASYILLYVRVAQLPRPFVSPLGVGGAAAGLVLALALGVVGPMFVDPFFYGILLACVGVWGVGAVVYWVWIAKARMADSPEKIFVRLQIQQLYGRRVPGPVRSHPPSDSGHAPDANGDNLAPTGAWTARTAAATLGHALGRAPPRHHQGSQGTLRVHDHSMPTLAVHSLAGTPMSPPSPMCIPPAQFAGPRSVGLVVTRRLPALLRYGSAFAYRPAATSEVRTVDTLSASGTLMDHTSTLPLRREWTARHVDEVTVTVSQASDVSHDDQCDSEHRAAAPVRAATYPDPRFDVASPAIKRLTASSEAMLTRDSGVTDVSNGRPLSMGTGPPAPAAEGAADGRPND
ncbi:hypothetical protein BCR44DRAFT_1430610 [Catenaria anguillulae PL171]|uniref:Amino acid permease-domain-containing protein n=1 Tax=Catenaria anguillulae PL171 TaxID=765915 RepID=A0A1Y2HUL4_9FUNG|nr:hypothetical protein BCR44DRAFT_1430610 [Catenaria anguillulae PL171]